MSESVTITLTRKNEAKGLVDLGFTADWLRRTLPNMEWADKGDDTLHKIAEDFEITSISTEKRNA